MDALDDARALGDERLREVQASLFRAARADALMHAAARARALEAMAAAVRQAREEGMARLQQTMQSLRASERKASSSSEEGEGDSDDEEDHHPHAERRAARQPADEGHPIRGSE
jgi:hypothetical protein